MVSARACTALYSGEMDHGATPTTVPGACPRAIAGNIDIMMARQATHRTDIRPLDIQSHAGYVRVHRDDVVEERLKLLGSSSGSRRPMISPPPDRTEPPSRLP